MMRISLAVLALMCAAGIAQAQTYKVGVVNTETVLKEFPAAIDAQKKIEEQALKARDTLQMMQKEFETRFEAYRKQESLMSADAKKKEEESLQALRSRYAMYQEQKFSAQGEVAQMREMVFTPIREKVKDAINLVAKEEKLNLVLDKVVGVVLYSEDKADITYKVLDRLKRGDK